MIEREKSKTSIPNGSNDHDLFSLTRRCGFALSRIENAVVSFGRSLENVESDDKARILQDRVGGMILRYFSSSMPSPSTKEIGAIGIDLAAVRREREAERAILHQEREE